MDKKPKLPVVQVTRLTETTRVVEHIPHTVLRGAEMPPITDQLDEIWKALHALASDGVTLPPTALSMMKQIHEVKRKYPKGLIPVDVEVGKHHVKST